MLQDLNIFIHITFPLSLKNFKLFKIWFFNLPLRSARQFFYVCCFSSGPAKTSEAWNLNMTKSPKSMQHFSSLKFTYAMILKRTRSVKCIFNAANLMSEP